MRSGVGAIDIKLQVRFGSGMCRYALQAWIAVGGGGSPDGAQAAAGRRLSSDQLPQDDAQAVDVHLLGAPRPQQHLRRLTIEHIGQSLEEF